MAKINLLKVVLWIYFRANYKFPRYKPQQKKQHNNDNGNISKWKHTDFC